MEVRTSVNPVLHTNLIRGILGAFVAVPGAELLDTPTVRLWQDPDFAPDANTPTADFTAAVADFTDYAAKALTVVQPVNVGDETEAATGTVVWTISEAGAVTENTIYGYWIEVGGDVMAFERFPEDNEALMSSDGDQLVLNVVVPIAARPLA